jgi:hypothetical protein
MHGWQYAGGNSKAERREKPLKRTAPDVPPSGVLLVKNAKRGYI